MTQQSIITLVCSDPASVGTRLDKYLFTQYPDYSRSFFQELIQEGLVTVNQNKCKSNYHIKLNDQLSVTFRIKQYNLKPMHVDFEIVDQQPDFLVINKPAGLIVHPTQSALEEVTLVNGLLHRFKELQGFDDKERPGIVHRLDKNTSGLMLIARNQQAQIELASMFKDRKIHKTYLALVSKHTPKKDSIDLPIGRHAVERQKMTTWGIEARQALTHYKALAYYDDSTLVAANIVTGRTHQIRVHFAAIGHGLIGDSVYGTTSKLIKRQALHAWKISFEYKGKLHEYVQPIPEDFRSILHHCLLDTCTS